MRGAITTAANGTVKQLKTLERSQPAGRHVQPDQEENQHRRRRPRKAAPGSESATRAAAAGRREGGRARDPGAALRARLGLGDGSRPRRAARRRSPASPASRWCSCRATRATPRSSSMPVDSARLLSTTPNSQTLDFSDTPLRGHDANGSTSRRRRTNWPDSADELAEKVPTSAPTPYPRDDDRRLKWWDHNEKRVRVVDHWYKRGGDWCYTIYCGDVDPRGRREPVQEREGREHLQIFDVLSADVDHDNDRYGFYQRLEGAAGRDQPAPLARRCTS